MKPVSFLHFFLLFTWCGLFPLQAQQEQITRFDSLVQITPDGSLEVTETIAVISAQQEIKRGIFRDFPVEYTTHFGLRKEVGFEVEEVLRDGRKEQWATNSAANPGSVRVYIGDASRLLPPGPHTYTLRYRTTRQLHVGAEHDELYWNVTGNAWAFPIEEVTVRVVLPGGASADRVDAFTGVDGAKGTDWRVVARSPGEVTLSTTKALPPGEGFTIVVTWPKGYLDPDVTSDGLEALLADNMMLFGAILGLLAVFAYYTGAWILVGRDPGRGTIIAQFGPPAGFTPAAVRFVHGMGTFDDRSFGSAIIQLAVAGALRIEKEKDFKLIGTGDTSKLLPGQKKFLEALFAGGSPLVLVQSNHAILSKARAELQSWLRKDFEKGYFLRNTWWCVGGVLLSLIPAGLAFLQSPDVLVSLFMLVWLSVWTVGVSALLSSVLTNLRAGNWLAAVPLMLFSLPFVAGWIFGAFMLLMASSPWALAVFLLGSAMNGLFYHLLKAPTIEGREVMDHIEGFRHYLAVAERDRLDGMTSPVRTPELFEKFLPYALALDVEQKWSEQFTEVLAQSQYDPAWCSGSGWKGVGMTNLGSTLGGSMFSSLSAAATAPRSSGGSGGGGSSGGGGGGGGGGGW